MNAEVSANLAEARARALRRVRAGHVQARHRARGNRDGGSRCAGDGGGRGISRRPHGSCQSSLAWLLVGWRGALMWRGARAGLIAGLAALALPLSILPAVLRGDDERNELLSARSCPSAPVCCSGWSWPQPFRACVRRSSGRALPAGALPCGRFARRVPVRVPVSRRKRGHAGRTARLRRGRRSLRARGGAVAAYRAIKRN